MSEIEDRRQRAREAGQDAILSGERASAAIDEAIEVATQVKLTDEVVARYGDDRFDPTGSARRAVMREVLAACGFEVIE